jgi:uncharacterized glyoxalase superfamily protein PhnB
MTQGHEGHEHNHEVGPRHFFGVVPVLLVDDVLATVDFYREALGFEADFLYDNPPTYASVSRDDAIVNFALSVPAGRRNGVSQAGPGNGTDLYVVVGDINDVFEEFAQAGVSILSDPVNTDYGMREFKIEDLNGYQIIFGEEIEEEG